MDTEVPPVKYDRYSWYKTITTSHYRLNKKYHQMIRCATETIDEILIK